MAFLDAQPDVSGPLATTGYCMGGALSLRAAAQLSDRVVAAASFHGGNLAPDSGDGPAAVVPQVQAEVYVAHADEDPSMPPEQIERLETRLKTHEEGTGAVEEALDRILDALGVQPPETALIPKA